MHKLTRLWQYSCQTVSPNIICPLGMRTCWLCTLQCSLAKRKTEFLCRDNEGITLMAFANRSQLILFQIRREVAFSCFYEPQTVFYSAIIYQQISQISISKLVKTNPIAVCVTSAQLCGLFAFALCLNWAFTPLFSLGIYRKRISLHLESKFVLGTFCFRF